MPERVGERLVTVLVTLAVPDVADPEDAAALVADAAQSTALQVRHRRGGGSPTGARGDSGAGRSGAAVAGGGDHRRYAAVAEPGR